jgi:hypothetical protein
MAKKQDTGVSSRRQHMPGQFPHYHRPSGRCMCLDSCCYSRDTGCICGGCTGDGHDNCRGARLIAARLANAAVEQ